MPKPLNELERRVLDYIVEYLRSNTYQPSVREIGREFSIKSTKTVSELLQSLANKGWIERDPSRSRGVRVLGMERHPGAVTVPMLGGDTPEPWTYIEIDRRLVDSPGVFLVSMADDHLAAEGVRRGDLLMVEPVESESVDIGDLVAVRTASGVSIHRCQGVEAGLTLEPVRAGEVLLTLTATQARTALQGRVYCVVRRLRPPGARSQDAALATASPAG
jgi:repressor LexA